MKETDLYEQVEQYLSLKHPNIPHHWDLSGLWTPSHKARNLYGRLNARAWPDLFIAILAATPWSEGQPMVMSGLFLELKRAGARLKKRDGSWVNQHVAEQAAVLDNLCEQGYIAQFAVGYEEAVQLIESYLGGVS